MGEQSAQDLYVRLTEVHGELRSLRETTQACFAALETRLASVIGEDAGVLRLVTEIMAIHATCTGEDDARIEAAMARHSAMMQKLADMPARTLAGIIAKLTAIDQTQPLAERDDGDLLASVLRDLRALARSRDGR